MRLFGEDLPGRSVDRTGPTPARPLGRERPQPRRRRHPASGAGGGTLGATDLGDLGVAGAELVDPADTLGIITP